ncbi:hypothetical protein BYT27DRAFT_7258602 [Phlegmacium glaucopus]|nr:hypothetical protein BYT27DRAFT_7258602 [Phlegmacium glaucopus]
MICKYPQRYVSIREYTAKVVKPQKWCVYIPRRLLGPITEEDIGMEEDEDEVEEVLEPVVTQVAETSKAKGKCRNEGKIMEKKCATCKNKEKECVVGKGKRRCTECEASKTKCSFVPEGRGRSKAAPDAKVQHDEPLTLKRKRGEKAGPAPRAPHLPFIDIIMTSPATLPSIPTYLTKESIHTATNLRLELEIGQSQIQELEEEVVRLRAAFLESERALQRNWENSAHEHELFHARIDRLGGLGVMWSFTLLVSLLSRLVIGLLR